MRGARDRERVRGLAPHGAEADGAMPGYNRGRAAAKKKKKQQQAKKKAQALARQPSATESLARQASAAARKATEAALADAVEHERLGDAMEVECCAVKNEIAALSSPRGALHPGAAAHAASGAIGPVDADGVERRTDPSDGAGYTFEQFEEAYAERAQELWDLAGRIMLGESGPLGGAAAPLGPAPFRSFGKFQNASAAEVVKLQKLGLLDAEASVLAGKIGVAASPVVSLIAPEFGIPLAAVSGAAVGIGKAVNDAYGTETKVI